MRVMPRLVVSVFIALYVLFVVVYFGWLVNDLYPDLKVDQITLEEFLAAAGIPGTILTAVGEMLRRVWQNYTAGGRDWTNSPPEEAPKCDTCKRPLA